MKMEISLVTIILQETKFYNQDKLGELSFLLIKQENHLGVMDQEVIKYVQELDHGLHKQMLKKIYMLTMGTLELKLILMQIKVLIMI